ncbi:RpiR family transcriptional regulator [Haloactinopolyspora alba]|uniref:RpiR family transcriptional regulator n=1 Tax=Haloactinopolyspora alba TaxID=648780 RepID=A0A2P8EGF4_9ACTN|nr:MurR/RpiR family transcriptional regulator [Haloactinopolyspora alba]PSL08545.1 RpiR family transcriptional regulator [Haloactinopolyspora alba]
MSIQSNIQSKAASYPPSMRRVADAIRANPQVVLDRTISELARMCETSETSVVRFCRTLGLPGYVQLRLALATELGRETAQRGADEGHGADITPSDDTADMIAKIAFSERLCLEETAAGLDAAVLEAVVGAIDAAGRTTVYGVGASGWSAADLQRKLMRIGRVAFAFGDAHDAMVAASIGGAGDVAVAFSHSGATREAVEFLRAASAHGSTTVAVTNISDSALAEAADLTLLTVVRETTFRSGAMASRIAQLMLVDCVFVGVAQRRYEPTVELLRTTYDSVAPLREDR